MTDEGPHRLTRGRDDYLRRVFEDYAEGLAQVGPDLTLALLQTRLEQGMEFEQAAEDADPDTLQAEIAFVLFLSIFSRYGATPAEFQMQEAILHSLLSPDAPWQLRITYGKRGRPRSAFTSAGQLARDLSLVREIDGLVGSGIKVEAAVADAARKFGVKRSSVFAVWQQRQSDVDRQTALSEQLEAYRQAVTPEPTVVVEEKLIGFFSRIFRYISQEFN